MSALRIAGRVLWYGFLVLVGVATVAMAVSNARNDDDPARPPARTTEQEAREACRGQADPALCEQGHIEMSDALDDAGIP